MIVRKHLHGALPLFFLCFALFSGTTLASSEAPAATPTAASSSPSESLEKRIKDFNRDLAELVILQDKAVGEDKLAMQLQMFQKNEELRTLISQAIKGKSTDAKFLIAQVNQQQKYSKGGIKYLTERSTKLSEEISNANSEDKFALLSDYSEARKYLDSLYEEQSRNIDWLKKLDALDPTVQKNFDKDIIRRTEQLAANIEYLKQQLSADNAQLSVAPESEKAAIQLRKLITQRRMDITTTSLRTMIEMADEEGIPSAEYKRLYFEVTGSVTQDLLSTDVIFAIIKTWSSKFGNWFIENAPQHIFQLFVFLVILLVARQIANITRRVVKHAVATKNFKLSMLMQEFFISMSGKAVWFIGILIALSQIGLNLTPILTGFGIAGVIIGFALQDTLSNFAAGMMLLIYRPFDVGDFVSAGGVEGKVSHMSLVNTTIKTFDNQIIIVPNSKIWGDVIKNVTHERVRRVDMVFGCSYSDDVEKVEKVLTDIVMNHPSVLRAPEPVIKLHVLNSSSLDFIVRPWVKTDDYWDVYWDVTREVKIRFDKEGISIPFPQQDVHLHMASSDIPPLPKNEL
ncbi:mechanosensitive ion channel protein MscS [Enterovibrio norvegicus]|uniref:Small-conductance mechanosensitive channel n=1 Tax=Enterovibrio norvegicus TaxID=188144 RepID=A0ABV4L7Y7_9GAMM|nr:mechanosensitive ion channel domain-containing protein [Enterovibrio norvegicus]MCC4797104.1 mechanosensitive ion channel [Enterovibrio norvegicus]OEF58163.1 mechanosensitive ion channel protein MscS [Enterovibrio norvegicus]PMI31332.1 mechanosensitive ion channel protein MscS [Enterovibrio norvegicus]PMI40831.1 mechanosensitive ion channel protein MscS [Enterovibrio norvegicus]PMN56281.1 mechanosensitive ion channel protein MscS [Enterovibrio norvegicus]